MGFRVPLVFLLLVAGLTWVSDANATVQAKTDAGDRVLKSWEGVRPSSRRLLTNGSGVTVVIKKDSPTPSPPPPSVIIIKTSDPSPSPKKVIKVVSAPSPPPPSKVFKKFPFFP